MRPLRPPLDFLALVCEVSQQIYLKVLMLASAYSFSKANSVGYNKSGGKEAGKDGYGEWFVELVGLWIVYFCSSPPTKPGTASIEKGGEILSLDDSLYLRLVCRRIFFPCKHSTET